MKSRVLVGTAALLFAVASSTSSLYAAATEAKPADVSNPAPGLVGAYYQKVNTFDAFLKSKANPFLVRVDNQVNFPKVEGQFYKTKLANDFGVRWTGALKVETASKSDNPVAGIAAAYAGLMDVFQAAA